MIVLEAFATIMKALLDAPFIVQFPIGVMAGALTALLAFNSPHRFDT